MKDLIRIGLAGLCLAAFAALAPAQDEDPPVDPQDDEDILGPNPFRPPAQGGLEEEMRKLFHQVERNLKRIDLQLADAGAGVVPLSEVEDSGLDDLLRDTGSQSRQVVSDIDRILEIAQELGSQQNMGGQGQKSDQPQEGEPSQQRDSGAPREREQTEEGPPEGQEEGKEPQDGQPKDGDQPDSPRGTEDPGENRTGPPPPDDPQDPTARGDDKDRWGDLPPRAQEIFRNQGRDDMPVQYRDWIDNYYRRLNNSRSGTGSGR